MWKRIGRLTVVVVASFVATYAPQALLAKDALDAERLGLAPASAYRLVDGHCQDCGASRAALWYFEDDLVAVRPGSRQTAASLVWVGSPEILEHATLSSDDRRVRLANGDERPFALAPKIPTNRSYYDRATSCFLADRRLRLRGRSTEDGGFVARTIWPEDLTLEMGGPVAPLPRGASIDGLVTSASARSPRVLWQRASAGRSLTGRAALAFVLSGAQGDDDEAHGGHFAVATGVVGPGGEWADWTVNNFYNLDSVSEKGIVAARVPMDNYLMDLNSGQAYYRPNDVLAVVLRDDRTAAAFQQAIDGVYERFYRHDVLYHHSASNCAGISLDTLRGLGWSIPRRGPTGYAKATAAFLYMGAKDRSVRSGEKIFDYLTEEQTRLLPRVAFAAAGDDLLRLLRGERKARTTYEQRLEQDAEAVVYVHVPQIPSSRAFGTFAVGSFAEYQRRVPADTSQWKIVPVAARSFPTELREGAPLPRHRSNALPFATLAGVLVLGGGWGTTRTVRRVRRGGTLRRRAS
jgi:hypothetical protein